MIRQRIEARQASLCVIGTGTTGLPLAALWAEQGFRVWGVDRAFAGNGSLADWCLSRHTEACLADMYEAQVRRGTLRPTDAIQPGADAYIVCVPTPVDPTTKRPALRCLETAIDELCRVLTADGGGPSERLLCIESTVPPGTSARIAQRVRKATPGLAIGIAYCAERAFPGRLLEEVIGNPRVIGAADGETAQQALALYAAFARAELHTTDLQTAEFTKLVENAYRDVNLAFANEVALLARRYDVSPTEAIELANHHPRVHILRPGCGVGGECIPVDPWFLLSPNETQAQLIPAARRVNDAVPARIAEEIMHHLPGGG
ncbi:MAG: nucleotide sugar dehydrogenase, partial [Armatimonadetes bacterium]|nr:nucleotide sugar dehydrogenase [Armatimonadota bacterium]